MLALVVAGCSSGEQKESAPTEAHLASGKPLPDRCIARPVPEAATVTFVARGHAWALDPVSSRLVCLFRVRNAGSLAWGPRGDRALLASLEVKGIANAPRRPPTRVDPPASSWGRPIGKSIVFVGRGGRALLKAHPAGGGFTDVTPVRGARYRNVLYHPSGLAFAFVLRRGGRESLWMSSNRGLAPRMLVHGKSHTGFGALAFDTGGSTLYFTATHRDGRSHVHSIALPDPSFAGVVWRGTSGERLSDLFVGRREFALTAARSCESQRAMFIGGRHAEADALPGKGPSRALGWLDDDHLLVAAGGCGRKLDLYSVSAASLQARLLAGGVDSGSVRRAEDFPPPPLPRVLEGEQRVPA